MARVIFDIDGTLLESSDFDARLYRQAVSEVLGPVKIHDDWDSYQHVTDGGILRQLLAENDIPSPTSAFERVKSRFIALIEGHLGQEPCRPIRGAAALLRELVASEDHQVGLATGGWRRTAVAKLQSAGLDFDQIPLCSSDDAEDRQVIMRHCLESMPMEKWARLPGPVVYVGDGPWDLRASKALGWEFVAVGTRLEGVHRPWIQDFEDFEALLRSV